MDEVVLAIRQLEPLPWVEIHCHGGIEVVRMLLELFAEQGAQVCSWQDFQRATAESPLRGLARIALAHAPTVRTAAILLDQVHGALDSALAEIIGRLQQESADRAGEGLNKLLRFAGVGRHLTEPWRVVIAGAPNVGKSSLVNALAGYQRAIVAPTPGTTRDVVTTMLAFDGWPIEVADTAGWRAEAEALEQQGIERARTVVAEADLVLWVLEASAVPVFPGNINPAPRYVINKMDLPAAWNVAEVPGAVQVSALTGLGLADLCRYMVQVLVADPPPPGAAVPFSAAIVNRLGEARQSCLRDNSAAALNILERLRQGDGLSRSGAQQEI